MASASGELLLYNNNRDLAKVRRLLQQKLVDFVSSSPAVAKVAELALRHSLPKSLSYRQLPPEVITGQAQRSLVSASYPPERETNGGSLREVVIPCIFRE